MHTVAFETRIYRGTTALGKVPGDFRWVRGITVVRTSLLRDADGIESGQKTVDENREDRWKGVADVHDGFDEEDEHGENGDDNIEVGDAMISMRVSIVLGNSCSVEDTLTIGSKAREL